MSQDRPHIPVMLAEMLDGLAVTAGGVYVDGAFGFGGYASAILNAAPQARVVAIDRDPAVRPRAEELRRTYGARLTFLRGRFGDMARLVRGAGFKHVDGVTLDLGVSSMHIDQAERGFSFLRDGPLDMRMEQAGLSAAEVVNGMEAFALADIIYRYGEERASRRVARAIVESRRRRGPITTTGRLAAIVRSAVRKSRDGLDPATRTFQGLRIHVNDEIGEVRRGLLGAEDLLASKGRLTVVSFHSLEDREVKTFLRDRSREGGARRLPGETVPPPPAFELRPRRAIRCSPQEADVNPRARSARLRVAIRTSAAARPDWPTAKSGHRGWRR